jgi:hypothetical protein
MCGAANIANLTRGTRPAIATLPDVILALRHDELESNFLTRSCNVQSLDA